MPRRWIDTTADLFCAELDALGMTAPRDAIVDLLAERVAVIAAALHIAEVSARRYLDPATIHDMARDLVASFAVEAPGADPLRLPRDRRISAHTFGRTIAGLAEATRVLNAAADDPHPHADTVSGTISALAQVFVDAAAGMTAPVLVPSPLLERAARHLQIAAEAVHDGSRLDISAADGPLLVEAFLADAEKLRAAARASSHVPPVPTSRAAARPGETPED